MVAQSLTLNPGICELTNALLNGQCSLHLISGGFVELASYIASKLGFQSFHANTLLRSSGKLTGEVADPIVGAEAKYNYLLNTCKQSSIKPEHCMAVGDGANDRLMLEAAGFALGYNPKPVLFDSLDGAVFGSFLPLTYLIELNSRSF